MKTISKFQHKQQYRTYYEVPKGSQCKKREVKNFQNLWIMQFASYTPNVVTMG